MLSRATALECLPNYIAGRAVASPSARRLPVTDPSTGEAIVDVPMSSAEDLAEAVGAASRAQRDWARTPVGERVQVLFRLKALIEEDMGVLVAVLCRENGKTPAEAQQSIARGIECIELASGLPALLAGPALEVSRGVECRMVREPLGVVAGVSPFNFPLMIPLWMAPLAIGCGNAFILKPSEQTPMSAVELARLFDRAGLPPGIFSVVHGDREIVEAICDAPGIAAVGFVGSTPVAREVHRRSAAAGKRVRALGGAKNHLVVMPDADPETAVENVVASATGCAGQRCMAAGVMVAVGDCEPIVSRVRARMATLEPGVDFGPVISAAALDRIAGYNERAGAAVTVDGRMKSGPEGGHYIGASVIETNDPTHEAAWREIFGPTLTVIRCATLEEAIEIENAEPHGNAASIYTRSGEAARRFAQAAASGMIGVNVGVPVPREPFPFGGWGASAFGDGDLTGPAAIDFWTRAKKITAKWVAI